MNAPLAEPNESTSRVVSRLPGSIIPNASVCSGT
jgi:hypothetical protein